MSGQRREPGEALSGWVSRWLLLLILAVALMTACPLLEHLPRLDPPQKLPPVSLESLCEARVELISRELRGYIDEHGGALPASLERLRDWWHMVGGLHCPSKRPTGVDSASGAAPIDYEYLGAGLTRKELEALPYPGWFPIVFDKKGNHKNRTRSVLSCGELDRHLDRQTEVRLMTEKEFQASLRSLATKFEQMGQKSVASKLRAYLESERSGRS